ncbi:MAG: TolC family protein [Bacteroidales bacterium]
MQMKKIALSVLFLSAFYLAKGQQILSLQDCVEQALDKNYSIKIMRNKQQKAGNDVNYSQFMPSVNATGRQNQNVYQTETTTSGVNLEKDATSDLYSAGVELSWTLFDGLAMFTDHNRYREIERIGKLNTRMAIENLILSVSELYYQVIVEHSKLQATAHTLELSNDRFNEARDKYRLGVLSGLDMQQAKIDLNADSSTYMRQKEYLKRAYIALNLSMSGDLQQTGFVRDSIRLSDPLSFNLLEVNTLEHNTLLQIARKEMRISDLDMKMARSALFPTLSLNTGYNYSRTENPASVNSLNQYHGPYWGFSVKVPLFNRMETIRKIRNSKLDRQNADLSFQDARLQLMGDLAQLYNTYENNLHIVGFENESAEVAYDNLGAALQKYKIGSLSGIEFREFQRSYIDAVNRKLSAIYQAKVSELSLLLISGAITTTIKP